MSNKLVTMQQVRIIIQLLLKGYSGRKISRELQISRNTVKQYTDCLQATAFSLEALQQMDDASLSAIAYADAKQMQQADSTMEILKAGYLIFLLSLNAPV